MLDPTALVFLKLGGSLITDKSRAQTARADVLARLANEIAVAHSTRPHMQLLVGHGSGSFGHIEAHKHGTRQGVGTREQWRGYAEVAAIANRLNRLVFDALWAAGLPVLNFPPSASTVAEDGIVAGMALTPIRNALEYGLIPLVHGDVAYDRVRGGTIVSTEDVFGYLSAQLGPSRILLAGIELGVYKTYPGGHLFRDINADNIDDVRRSLRGSDATDVTGGMESKVLGMFEQVRARPGLQIRIFSGQIAGHLSAALLNELEMGTVIC